MIKKTPKQPLYDGRRLFSVRLTDEMAEAIRRRAVEDRRTILVTAEIIIAAGLEATASKSRKKVAA